MAKNQRKEAMSTSAEDLLPPEIWYQILAKLPVKSILRSRCVCKTWYSLISCPSFVSDHTSQTLTHSTSNRVLVRRQDTKTFLHRFSFHDESFVESHEHDDIPKQLLSHKVEFIGSYNGLVCLHKRDREAIHSFLIWNPSIRKLVQLASRPPSSAALSYILGFGFDSNSSDYKVVRIGYCMSHRFDDNVVANEVPVASEVFDLRKGVWRSLSPPTRPFYIEEPCLCVYLNGNLHWIGNERFLNCSMLSFNLSDEVFQEMWVPGGQEYEEEEMLDDCFGYTKIFPINRLLTVAVVRREEEADVCTAWSMKEYGVTKSWTKLFCIDLPRYRSYLVRWLDLLRFWENGEVLLVKRVAPKKDAAENDGDGLVLYDPESRKCKVLLSTNGYVCDVWFYDESLVLL